MGGRTIRTTVREFRLPNGLGRLVVREDNRRTSVTLFPSSVPAEPMATQAAGGQTAVQALNAMATHFMRLAQAVTLLALEEEADGPARADGPRLEAVLLAEAMRIGITLDPAVAARIAQEEVWAQTAWPAGESSLAELLTRAGIDPMDPSVGGGP